MNESTNDNLTTVKYSNQTTNAVPTAPAPPANSYMIPVSIVIAGGFIAAAVFFSGGMNKTVTSNQLAQPTQPTQPAPPTGNTDAVKKVTKEDHIKGNPNAKVVIVEYSDMECPFCKRFHGTMNAIMNKLGDSGDVAWVYRHFPLDQLHPKNARKVAVASECANEQGGNEMFWKFTDRWFELTASNDRTDLTVVLPQIYSEVGLNQGQMDACISSGKYDQHIKDNESNAIATGGRGTPWSVVIGADGKTYPLNGAQPQASVEQLINIAKGS